MEIRYLKHYSSHLYREMEIKIYGHAGKPVLFIPCQGGRFFDFENFQRECPRGALPSGAFCGDEFGVCPHGPTRQHEVGQRKGCL